MTNDETNPKSEIRNPKEIRMPKPEIRREKISDRSSVSGFGLRHSFVIRHWPFVISSAARSGWNTIMLSGGKGKSPREDWLWQGSSFEITPPELPTFVPPWDAG